MMMAGRLAGPEGYFLFTLSTPFTTAVEWLYRALIPRKEAQPRQDGTTPVQVTSPNLNGLCTRVSN